MLHLYADDSKADEPGVFVLQGIIGHPEPMARLKDKWSHTISEWDLPAFKMNKANRWRPRRLKILRDLIQQHAVASVGIGFEIGMLREKMQQHPEQLMLNPYFFAFTSLIGFTAKLRQLGGEQIEFFFDHQNLDEKLVLAAWDRFRASAPPDAAARIMVKPTFGTEQKHILLQPADFCAWWGRQWMLKGLGQSTRPAEQVGQMQIDPSYFFRMNACDFDWILNSDLAYFARKKARLGESATFY
ncbi:hypothetical protein [Bradyrhizobium sp. JYMT SZCCT0428]|uniref:hypothetical protein n=1 Tax=Bradyrhizobium sp. JYMT SZCCT0428 TaxID=2807673 RepID=UPI001BAB0662|nr:hypothetical protein [Bradyrhizobium sp. JYMT SZCCT0428]MBR1150061.1 hypothetical protein [Bradyrhizobium sp. JYMT SZCCT0428]